MIGLLRFVGLANAAVWFGAAVFFVVGAIPAASSPEMRALLGPRNYPYFSVAISDIVAARYFDLHLICSVTALAHLAAEWFYLGRRLRKFWLGLLASLIAAGLVGGWEVLPRMKQLHETAYTVQAKPEDRAAAGRAFRFWHGAFTTENVLLVAGLALYFWRLSNPPDPTRRVGAAKFSPVTRQ